MVLHGSPRRENLPNMWGAQSRTITRDRLASPVSLARHHKSGSDVAAHPSELQVHHVADHQPARLPRVDGADYAVTACDRCGHYIWKRDHTGRRCVYGFCIHLDYCKWSTENVDAISTRTRLQDRREEETERSQRKRDLLHLRPEDPGESMESC